MPTLRIPNFQGVSVRKDGVLQEAIQGMASEAFNVDPYHREGGLISAKSPGDMAVSGSTPRMDQIIQDPLGGNWGITSDGLWKTTGGTWAKIGGTTNGPNAYGIAYYRDYIYYTSGADTFGRYGPLSNSPTVTNVWQTLSDGTASRIRAKNGILWLMKSAGVLDVRPSINSWDDTDFAEDDILLDPQGGRVTAFGESRELLLAGIGRKVVVWDGNEEGTNFTLEFDDIVSAIAYAENVSYIITRKSAYSFTQDGGVRHLFEIPDRFRGGDEMDTITVTEAAPFNKLILFGNKRGVGEASKPFSLWAFPRIQYVKNPLPFEYYRETKTNTINAGVHGVYGNDDEIVFSRVDENGDEFVSRVSSGQGRASGEWATQYLDFGFPDFDKDIYSVEVVHDALGADDSVEVEFAVDQSDAFASKLLSDTDGKVAKSKGVSGIRGRKISVKLKTEGDVLVRDVIIGYRVLPKTI